MVYKDLAERLEADSQVIDQAFDKANQRILKSSTIENNENKETSPSKLKLKSMRIRSAELKERTALRNKSGEAANDLIDQALCDQKKRLNAMKAETIKKKSMLKDLETTYDQLVKEASFSVEMSKGESKSAQKLTLLENRLDMAKRKSAEAMHIHKVYNLLHQHLEEQSLSFHGQLDDLETQIRKSKNELEDIRIMYEDAQKSRDEARAQLLTTEERIQCQRRVYEKQLNELRDKAAKVQRQARNQDFSKAGSKAAGSTSNEDEKLTVFQDSRKTQMTSRAESKKTTDMIDDHIMTMEEYEQSAIVMEQNQKIEELEQHFQKIKEVTGVSELAQIVSRFEDQAKTHNDLEEKRKFNIAESQRLKSELEQAKKQLNEQKYGDLGSDSILQKFNKEYEIAQETLNLKKKQTMDLQVRAEENRKLVNNLAHSLANLTEKLERVRLDKSEEKSISVMQNQHQSLNPENITSTVIDELFNRCNTRINKLIETLPKNNELSIILDTAKTDDVYLSALENRMPAHNVRINNLNRENSVTTETAPGEEAERSKSGKKNENASKNFADDSESGEDNVEYFSRDALKKQGMQLIDSRSKKNRNGRSRQSRRRGFKF